MSTGMEVGYWTLTGYWRFPVGSKSKFEDLLMEQVEEEPKAVKVRLRCYCFYACPLFCFVLSSFHAFLDLT